MNYTQGEWKIETYSKGDFLIMGNASTCVARVVQTYDPECQEANAQLIASAPDLYEALKRLLKETSILDNEQCDHDVGICWCSYKNARFVANHALAKAEDKYD